ncbi:MAG TPA: hypothetical protein VLX85_02415 [Stellaceae bacterium]|nr:hypothetical protein [Stellaceae bacterium]
MAESGVSRRSRRHSIDESEDQEGGRVNSSFGARGVWRLLFLVLIVVAPSPSSRAGNADALPSSAPASAPDMKTLKERLSDKASDEQRVDNCRVPSDRRGTKPRPDCARPLSRPSAKSD